MYRWYRGGFYAGLILVLVGGVFLFWLWQPRYQVKRHTENLLRAFERKDWASLQSFLAPDYHDQWHNDRSLLMERTREISRYLRRLQISAGQPTIRIDHESAYWESQITIKADPNEITPMFEDRLNSLTTPFDLEWRHASRKPWDWKLISVKNAGLEIPELAE